MNWPRCWAKDGRLFCRSCLGSAAFSLRSLPICCSIWRGQILQVDVQEKIGVRIQRRVIDKVQKVELASFEHPSFYDALKRANEDLSGRLLSLLNVVLDVIGALGGLVAIVAVLLTGHWVLGPLVVIGSVPGVWVMMRMN